MADNKCSCFGSERNATETVCIDTYRVLDSCRDRDCYEDTRVFLSPIGQEIIEHTTNVRARRACILKSYVTVDPVNFNQGFYQVTVRTYIKLTLEACVCPGRAQEFEGLAVVEKRVILYGSEGSVRIFRSNACGDFCTPANDGEFETNNPTAVVEIASPVILGVRVLEPCNCCNCYSCCSCDAVPTGVRSCFAGDLTDCENTNRLYVSLGIFSVVRIERPAQYLITAGDYSVPDKECTVAEEDDACALFRSMAFPTREFSPPSMSVNYTAQNGGGGCGCRSTRDCGTKG